MSDNNKPKGLGQQIHEAMEECMTEELSTVAVKYAPSVLLPSLRGFSSLLHGLGLRAPYDPTQWGTVLIGHLDNPIAKSNEQKLGLVLAMIMTVDEELFNLFGGEDGSVSRLLIGMEIVIRTRLRIPDPYTFVRSAEMRGANEQPAEDLLQHFSNLAKRTFHPENILETFCPVRGVKHFMYKYKHIIQYALHHLRVKSLERTAILPSVMMAFNILTDPFKKKVFEDDGISGILRIELDRVLTMINERFPGHLIDVPEIQTRAGASRPLQEMRARNEGLMLDARYARMLSSLKTELEINSTLTNFLYDDESLSFENLRELVTVNDTLYKQLRDEKKRNNTLVKDMMDLTINAGLCTVVQGENDEEEIEIVEEEEEEEEEQAPVVVPNKPTPAKKNVRRGLRGGAFKKPKTEKDE